MLTRRRLLALGQLGGGGVAPPAGLTLTATTTGAGQTVTLKMITPTGGTCTVSWGDGGAYSIIANGNTEATTHVYESAGSYNITISDSSRITYLDLSDSKLGCAAGEIGALTDLTSLVLSVANVTIGAGEIGALTKLTSLSLTFVANVTIGAGEIGALTDLTHLSLYSVANVTIGTGEIGALTDLTSLYLRSVANVTIGAGEIGALTDLTYLYLYDVANVTIGAGEIGALTDLTYLYMRSVAGVTTQRADFATLLKLTSLAYLNSLSGPQVDAVLAGLYDGFPTRTGMGGSVVVSSTNAAPSGTYQAATICPPTDGKEIAYELLNDTCNVSTKHWAGVTITA